MNRTVLKFVALISVLGFAGISGAHHPPKIERCESFAFTGQIERIEWRRPHVELFVRTAEGATHQVTWLAINQLGLQGIDRETLRIGDQVIIIAGIRPNDAVERPMLLSYIHRDSDGWGWAEAPQGC
jgi:hypothetical protein